MAGGVSEAKGESPLWHRDRQGFASYVREALGKGGEGRDKGVRDVVQGPITTLLREMNTQVREGGLGALFVYPLFIDMWGGQISSPLPSLD